MEDNISDAIFLAGSVLVFLIALTICISSFTTLRAGVDKIVEHRENVKMSKNSDAYINYIKSRDSGATRLVGANTVLSSMYRTQKENFEVYVKLNNTNVLNNLELLGLKIDNDSNDDKILRFTLNKNDSILEDSNKMKDFYNLIKEYSFLEYLGIYQNKADEVTTENKLTYRIITYIQQD